MNLLSIRLILLITTFSMVLSACFAQDLSVLKLKHQNSFIIDTTKKKTELDEKSPLLAGTLSFIVPGLALGQIYNDVEGKVYRHLGITLGCIVFLGIASETKLIKLDVGGSGYGEEFFLGIVVIYLGNWVWSVVDAVITANDINRQVKIQRRNKKGN